VLDGYMMGALDSLPVSGSVVADPERMMIIKCEGGRKCLFDLSRDDAGNHVSTQAIASNSHPSPSIHPSIRGV
jgi:hypothetical protein